MNSLILFSYTLLGDDMYFKFYFFSFVLLLFCAFMSQHFVPFHSFVLVISFKMYQMKQTNRDYFYVLLIWIYKCMLLFFIKNDALLWVIYDVLCILLASYFLLRALKYLFCK